MTEQHSAVSPASFLLIGLHRFGNFIGEEPEASEEESEHGVDAGAYLDDEYPEEAPEVAGQ